MSERTDSNLVHIFRTVVVGVAIVFGSYLIGEGLAKVGRGIMAQQLETMITSMQIQQGAIPIVPPASLRDA
jgi:hypothetical protein